jgi:phospholipid/cholesterol/gamma-HCH transport system permease protein
MNTLAPPRKAPAASVVAEGAEPTISLTGAWSMTHAREAEKALEALSGQISQAKSLKLDLAGVEEMDTLGAWLIARLGFERASDFGLSYENMRGAHSKLIEEVSRVHHKEPAKARSLMVMTVLADIGETVVGAWRDVISGVSFLGSIIAAAGRLILHPRRFRFAALVNQVEHVALRGAPLIMLISALVGAIVAQQAVFQLQTFGSTAFVADLLGILVLRELAVLLSAIMVAGRSGSAFTAEIGSMRMREEVDALRTMGLDPLEVLIVPRILGLMIGLPILVFLAAMAGLFGGGLVTVHYGNVSVDVFLTRLQSVIGMNTFLVGLIKAPFMALVIGLIACLEGLKVAGSAESLGRHTTSSVVKSIFMVIVLDGLFAMFFAAIRY